MKEGYDQLKNTDSIIYKINGKFLQEYKNEYVKLFNREMQKYV